MMINETYLYQFDQARSALEGHLWESSYQFKEVIYNGHKLHQRYEYLVLRVLGT